MVAIGLEVHTLIRDRGLYFARFANFPYKTKVRFTHRRICTQLDAGEAGVANAKPVVIVIDDDPSILRALRRLISGAGFDVRIFDRPSELLKSELPTDEACLIVDVHLPGMNGVDLCATLVASGCKLPVILITAHADEETRSLASSAHPVALLMKPFGRDLLVNTIETALERGKNPQSD
jgi:FixJ family two-component response regulator